MRGAIAFAGSCVFMLSTVAVGDVMEIGGRLYEFSNQAYLGQAPAEIGPGNLTTGFEAVDGFVPGFIGGQSGWTTFAASLTQGHIDTANPAAGAQHLRISKDPALASGILTGAFSPDQGPLAVGPSSVSVDIAISNTGGADYDVSPQAPSQAMISARVKFSFVGNIFIVDDLGAGLVFVDTGVAWNAGPYTNLTINIDPVANTIDYIYGGAPIYSSVGGVFAGTTIEQVVLFSDNFHVAGESGDFDNFSVVEIDVCPTDVNGDGVTNVLDLIDLLLCFGQPATGDCEDEDINGDGDVDVLDLIDLLLAFGTTCP